jgi:glycosyltransferase involved in cell wall biosynthesis
MSQSRLFYITSSFYPRIGGAENQTLQILKLLAESNSFSTIVWTTKETGLSSREILFGFEIRRLGIPWLPGKLRVLSFLAHLSVEILKISKPKSAVLHVLGTNSHYLCALFWKTFLGYSLICRIRREGPGADLEKMITKFGKSLASKLFRKTDTFVVLTSSMQKSAILKGIGKDSTLLIPNGVDTSRFHPIGIEEKSFLRNKFNLPESARIACTISRLIPRKNLKVLISAISQISHLDLHFLIVGSGPELDRLQVFVDHHSLEDKIHFISEISFSEVHQLYQLSDLYLSASESEGMSNSLLEAISCGCFPLYFYTPGIEEILHSKHLVHQNDTQTWTLRLQDTLEIELGAYDFDFDDWRAEFSLEAVANSYHKLYQQKMDMTP